MRKSWIKLMLMTLTPFVQLSALGATNASPENGKAHDLAPVRWSLAKQEIAASEAVIVVTTSTWNSFSGEAVLLLRHEEKWDISEPIQVVVGRHGLGWGIGVEDFRYMSGPTKIEGDGRGPAGVFQLRQSFGTEEPLGGLPHLAISPSHVCVDDVHSQFYNRIIDEKLVTKDWNSFEQMLIPPYRLGIEVAHNYDMPVPGGGSCIFMHLWQGPDKGTAGCTAMSDQSLTQLMGKLPAKTVLVQMPEDSYQSLAGMLGLPSVTFH